MFDYVFELPHNQPTSGGVYHTIGLAQSLQEMGRSVQIRFHQITHRHSVPVHIPTSVGLPDNAFPQCRHAITYSDTPYIPELLRLEQVLHLGVLMLSYGMAVERERPNATQERITVMASTLRNMRAISRDGGRPNYVGFGFDASHWFPECPSKPPEKFAAILRHPNTDKRTDLAIEVAEELCNRRLIDSYVTFGPPPQEGVVIRERNCRGHISNATHSELRELFSSCVVYIMPSVTEGLNRTPAEATLCGCPSVLCDGALDELYVPDVNCKWVKKDSYHGLLDAAEDIILNEYSGQWRESMQKRVAPYTFTSMATRVHVTMENGHARRV